ncbi:MAG TPA: hypothetical protein VGL94_06965 [Ktedonobacteraceae bacterium]
MKALLNSYRIKRARKTEKLLIGPLPEQRRKDQETVLPSLQEPSATQRERQAPLAGQKSQKKHRIPFVALALVLLFSCLCVVSLVSQQPLARATALSSSATLHHAVSRALQDMPTSTSDCIVTDCYGQLATPNPWGTFQYSLASDCTNHYQTVAGDAFCWNDSDFQWGARDITCIQAQKPENLKWPVGTTPGLPTTAQATPGASSGSQSTLLNNQNTCTENSVCYSDNRSSNDDSGQIHARTGGDDLICFNKACIGQGGDSTNAHCGGLPFDKFGCAPIPQANNYFYNPTAYNPFAYFILASANLSLDGKNGSIQTGASNDMPTCDPEQSRWTCSNGDNIYLALTLESGTFANPFTGNPEEISSSISQAVTTSSSSGGGQGGGVSSQTQTSQEPEYQVGCYNTGSSWVFPCSDSKSGKINEAVLQNDWLSGNSGTGGTEKHPGHISVTYADETHSQTYLVSLYSLTLALGYTLVTPALILIGYQLLWSSWTFGRVAAMEMLARLLLSILAVSMSYELTTMLIGLSNVVSHGVVSLHASLGYPDVKLNGNNLTYTLEGESDPSSFRGIVVPVSRWGCVMNTFMEILLQKVVTDMLAFVPFVGGLLKLAKGIHDAVQALKDLGEFLTLVLSINFAVQVFVRVVLVNYYILTAPVAFGCWGLPGGFGQKVVGQWFKGFCSILLTQGVQLFVLTTLPLLLPDLPQLPTDSFGIFTIILKQLPRVIVLMAVIKVPTMMGTRATKAIAQAGAVSSGAVTALGAAAYQIV